MWHSAFVAAPIDPRAEADSGSPTRRANVSAELERELRNAVDEIERGDCILLSAEDVDRWAETGVPPWPDVSPG